MKKNLTHTMLMVAVAITVNTTTLFAETHSIPENNSQPRVALVLAGGGAWGLAHIGVIRVIEEAGIPVDMVIGTSMGAIVGGFYAMGGTAEDLEQIARTTDWVDLFSENRPPDRENYFDTRDRSQYLFEAEFDRSGIRIQGGLLAGNRILRFVDCLTADLEFPRHFDNLARQYRAVATDINSRERIILDEGHLADAMRASMGIPGVFAPYLQNGRYLVDGFLVDNLPIQLARDLGADIVIAVDLDEISRPNDYQAAHNPVTTIFNTFNILVRGNVERQLDKADLVIAVDIHGFSQTDFPLVEELIALGDKTARSRINDLAAIREQVMAGMTDPQENTRTNLELRTARPFQRISITGGTEQDQTRTLAYFSHLIGKPVNTDELCLAAVAAENTGHYSAVRLWRTQDGDQDILRVHLTPKSRRGHGLRVHLDYESSYSHYIVSSLRLSPSVILRDLTTRNSRLAIDFRIMDAPAVYGEFIQPMGEHAYIGLTAAAARDYDMMLTGSGPGYQYQTITRNLGGRIGVLPVNGMDINLGWRYDWIDRERLPEFSATEAVDTASLVVFSIQYNRRDSAIFPMNGVTGKADFTASLPELNSERRFMVLTTSGSTFLSLGTPFSVALLWQAGTDFSLRDDEIRSAPPLYKPDLANRRLFPAPLLLADRIGSHVIGAGIEIKHHLNWADRGITLPVFLLGQTSAGSVMQDAPEAPVRWPIHWTASVGAGIRVNQAFGIALRGGAAITTSQEIQPFLALDMGALGFK